MLPQRASLTTNTKNRCTPLLQTIRNRPLPPGTRDCCHPRDRPAAGHSAAADRAAERAGQGRRPREKPAAGAGAGREGASCCGGTGLSSLHPAFVGGKGFGGSLSVLSYVFFPSACSGLFDCNRVCSTCIDGMILDLMRMVPCSLSRNHYWGVPVSVPSMMRIANSLDHTVLDAVTVTLSSISDQMIHTNRG